MDDEILEYSGVRIEPESPDRVRLTGCRRGSNDTTPIAHASGSTVRHLAQRYGSYLVDLRSPLRDSVARRVSAPLPVLLAVAGFVLAAIPGMPRIPLDPNLILVLFLPPLLYADAFDTSWVDFKRWLRPILMLAVGLVAVTILVVGLVAHAVLPTLPWAACFTLGAIVSPTDTVAVQAVIERLRVPRRVTAIVGGESLVNDATGLVGVQIAVAVILSGAFDAGEVALGFARVAGLGVGVGMGIGIAFSYVNRAVRDTHVLFVLSLLAPYLAFLIATKLDASGVLAVVVSGFIVSWRIHTVPAEARVPLYSAWDLLISVLNGICFVFIGLETPHWLRLLHPEQGETLVWAALAVSATVVVVRIVWCFPGAYLPLFLSPRVRANEGGYPDWRGVTLVSWCGVRGVIFASIDVPAGSSRNTPSSRPRPTWRSGCPASFARAKDRWLSIRWTSPSGLNSRSPWMPPPASQTLKP